MCVIYQALSMSRVAVNAPTLRCYRGIVVTWNAFFAHTRNPWFCCSDGPGFFDFTQVRDFPPLWNTSKHQRWPLLPHKRPKLLPDGFSLIRLSFVTLTPLLFFDRATTIRHSKSLQPLSATPNGFWSILEDFLATAPCLIPL